MIKPIKRYRPERHYMRGPGPKWLRSMGVELIWLVLHGRPPQRQTSAHKPLLPACATLAQLGGAFVGMVVAALTFDKLHDLRFPSTMGILH
jgi:hypothetical protein